MKIHVPVAGRSAQTFAFIKVSPCPLPTNQVPPNPQTPTGDGCTTMWQRPFCTNHQQPPTRGVDQTHPLTGNDCHAHPEIKKPRNRNKPNANKRPGMDWKFGLNTDQALREFGSRLSDVARQRNMAAKAEKMNASFPAGHQRINTEKRPKKSPWCGANLILAHAGPGLTKTVTKPSSTAVEVENLGDFSIVNVNCKKISYSLKKWCAFYHTTYPRRKKHCCFYSTSSVIFPVLKNNHPLHLHPSEMGDGKFLTPKNSQTFHFGNFWAKKK